MGMKKVLLLGAAGVATTAVVGAVVVGAGNTILYGSLMAPKVDTPVLVAALPPAPAAPTTPAAEAPAVSGTEATVSASAVAAAPAAPAAPAFDPATTVANAAAGATIANKCKACHDLSNAAANKVGPALWGVVGRKVASHPGFAYSDAMKAHGGDWTPDRLNTYLENPKGVVPGTKMAFAGVKDPKERADLVAYLETLK